MNDISEIRYFVLIKKKEISFQALNEINQVIFKKQITVNDNSIKNIYVLIEGFLEKNIIDIEKRLKNFIKEIYIIFESDLFYDSTSSIKYGSRKINSIKESMREILLEKKDQFKKFSPKEDIIHMIVNNYIVDGTNYKFLPENINYNNLIIEVKFICLNNQIAYNLKKIFAKYQISIKRILNYDFLNHLDNENDHNIFSLADQSINGSLDNEVLIINKLEKNKGFFERFFNFFN